MGYYLIDKTSSQPFSIFLSRMEDSIYQIEGDLDNFIIVESSKENAPYLLKDSPAFKHLCKKKFRVALEAQDLFCEQAKKNRFLPAKISQDQESFKDYCDVLQTVSVKRADYVISNCKDIEVEVKCLTFYKIKGELHFFIKYHEIKRLNNLNEMTAKNTVLAIFRQENEQLDPKSLTMIKLSTILKENNKSVKYDVHHKCFVVPIRLTTPGFKILEDAKIVGKEIQNSN